MADQEATPSYSVLLSGISEKDELSFMRVYANFMEDSKNTEGEVSKRVHAMAVKFNRPDNGKVAAIAFKKHIINYIVELRKENPKLNSSIFGLKEDDGEYKIAGNGAFANAFKRVYNAMWFGADLLKEQTVSAAQAFAKKAAAEEAKERTKNELREAIALDLAASDKWLGKSTVDNPDFEREVNRELTNQLDTRNTAKSDTGTNDSDRISDIWTTRAEGLAQMLRRIAEKSPDAEDMFEAFEMKVERKYEELFGEKAAEFLKKDVAAA